MSGPIHHRSGPGPVLTPLEAAAPFVGVPWRARGRTPSGWDCAGCVAYLRRLIWDVDSPGMTGDHYAAADALSADRAAERVSENLGAWSRVDPRPGAVILFEVLQRPAHVGLVLTDSDFVHSFGGEETTILRLSHPRWSGRIRGFYDTDRPSVYRP